MHCSTSSRRIGSAMSCGLFIALLTSALTVASDQSPLDRSTPRPGGALQLQRPRGRPSALRAGGRALTVRVQEVHPQDLSREKAWCNVDLLSDAQQNGRARRGRRCPRRPRRRQLPLAARSVPMLEQEGKRTRIRIWSESPRFSVGAAHARAREREKAGRTVGSTSLSLPCALPCSQSHAAGT